MNIILHRVNTIEMLKKTPTNLGVEIDIRSNGNILYLHHDPFIEGDLLDEWISHFKHGTIILNVKEEGLEDSIIHLMRKYNIDDYFFLDQSFPFLRKTSKQGERRCAVRVSEYENIQTPLSLNGIVDWVWVDCFTKFPLDLNAFKMLKSAGYKLCFVSPELQGFTDHSFVKKFRQEIDQLGIKGDAVCTKYPDLWA